MSKNKKAIAVYLDDSDIMETEFSWLYKTWKLWSLDKEYDLVVYYNPPAGKRIEKFVDVVKISMAPIRMALQYKFLNSHYFCLDEWSEPLKKYDYLLKTDCDVFLTHNLKGYEPSKLLVGQGGYYDTDDENKINFIKKISNDFNLKYRHMSNVGASFFGKTNLVLNLVKNQAIITEHILNKYFNENDVDLESVFKKEISSMIAGEVTVNGCLTNQHINLYTLDHKCWETTKIGSDVLHIHAWHTTQKWSKHDYFNGKYKDWVVKEEDMYKSAANYCQFISNIPLKKYEVAEFKNDGGILITLPNHKYSQTFKNRDNHEVMFRKIHSYLIDNLIIKNNIIDLGAWIGDNSIPWSKKIKGKVFSIDPSEGNCEFINEVCFLNEINNIKTIQKAISDQNKTISTKLEFGDKLHHCSFEENEEGKTIIDSYSLDYLEENNEIYDIGYIHLDVEGMEFTVIKGSIKIIEKYKPIITFEQHLNSDDYKGLSNFLIEKDYEICMINESLPGCYPDCRNFIAIPKDQKYVFDKIRVFFNDGLILIDFKTNNLKEFL